jgi:tetratricopeptide (TPR) repeat protein
MEDHARVLALLEQGEALRRQGMLAEALDAYGRALALDPDDTTAWINKGVTLSMLGRYQEALAAFDRAFALDSDNAAVWEYRGDALRALGRGDEAEDWERRVWQDWAAAHPFYDHM